MESSSRRFHFLYKTKRNEIFMKSIIVSAIIGLLGGLVGTFLFETTDGFMSNVFSDFTIGGVIVGVAGGIFGNKSTTLVKKLLFSVGVGLVVFLVFGLLSGYLMNDLIAGALIGLLVGLASHFFGAKVANVVNKVDEKIDNTLDKV